MRLKNILSTVLATVLLTGMAHAGEDKGYAPADLAKWKQEASAIVSETMRYPTVLGRRELRDDHTLVTAVIDRDGQIMRTELTEPSGNHHFDRASRDFLRHLGKLPALPDSIETDGAVVRMHLLYAGSADGLRQLQRQVVRMQRIAETDPAGDGTDLLTATDKAVIDLIGGGV